MSSSSLETETEVGLVIGEVDGYDRVQERDSAILGVVDEGVIAFYELSRRFEYFPDETAGFNIRDYKGKPPFNRQVIHFGQDRCANLSISSLMGLVRTGDEAFGQFVELYLPFVNFLARKFINKFGLPDGLEKEDLVQEARISLIKAASRFNPRLGVFTTFAGIRVWGTMQDIREKELRRDKIVGGKIRSIDDSVFNGSEEQLPLADRLPSDLISVEDAVLLRDLVFRIQDAIQNVPRISKKTRYMMAVALERRLTEKTQAEIGKELGVKGAYISQLMQRIKQLMAVENANL